MAVAVTYEALLPAPADFGPVLGTLDWRWNNFSPLGELTPPGTPFELSFGFMTVVPPHANPAEPDGANHGDGDAFGFRVFTDTQESAARAVLSLYAEISNLTFVENTVSPDSAQLLFGQNKQSASSGYAYLPDLLPVEGGDVGGDVYIARNATSNSRLNPGESGFATLLHEVGHALGLKHPFDDQEGESPTLPLSTESRHYTVMSYTDSDRPFFRTVTRTATKYIFSYEHVAPSTPMLYDIAAMQHLYGANMDTRSGDTVYDFSRNDPFYMCIWDGGGTDAISVSNFTRGCTINLNEGTFSSIKILPDAMPSGIKDPNEARVYNGTKNLSIAFGVTIENAVGGSGHDKLTGNGAGNALTGGSGNDTLTGGDGNDALDGGAGNDRLAGGAGDDVLVWQASDAKVDGGADSDTLKVSTALNLVTEKNQSRIVNIETIDMTGGGNDRLTLGRSDVLDLSSSTDILTIVGDAGDTVDLVGFVELETVDGFVSWKGGDAIVKIHEDVVNVI